LYITAPETAILAMSSAVKVPFEQIARAMIATSLTALAQSNVYHWPEVMALNR
jgi:hypothetical protein